MTDYDTRAEAVEAIKAHLTEFLVDYDAEELAWNILNDLGEVGWAAGRAATTTATLMARRDGKAQALIESLLAQAEGRGLTVEVVYPETTTATTEDITEALYEATQDPNDIEVPAVARRLHGLLSARNLLATARTRPTREAIEEAIEAGKVAHDDAVAAGGAVGPQNDYIAEEVDALLNHDQPTEAEAGARAVEDTAHILRRMELNGMHLTDMDISGWLHERAARIRGGDDRG